MKAYVATFCASSLSGLVLLGCFLAMCQIHNNITDIYEELEVEMNGFKDITDDLWRDMLRIGSKTQVSNQ
jgi:hypothetical protein